MLRYHTANKRKEPEAYFHHLMMLCYPWRDEDYLLAEHGTYVSKFLEPGVHSVIESNRRIFEPDADVDESLQQLRENEGNRMESYGVINDQENADVHEQILESLTRRMFLSTITISFWPNTVREYW